MPKPIVLLAVLALAGCALAQSPAEKIGPSAVWQPPNNFFSQAQAACAKLGAPPDACIIDQMGKAGAPAAAVQFSRDVYKVTNEVGILSAFHKVGRVDIAWVMYPLRASNMHGLLLVNGQPPIVNAEDLKLLDQKGLQQSPQFQDLLNQYPKAALWPGDREGNTWPNSQTGPNGGLQFVIGYPLRNGCANCAHAGFALFTWNFDAGGKFTGTSFLGMTPAPLNQ